MITNTTAMVSTVRRRASLLVCGLRVTTPMFEGWMFAIDRCRSGPAFAVTVAGARVRQVHRSFVDVSPKLTIPVSRRYAPRALGCYKPSPIRAVWIATTA